MIDNFDNLFEQLLTALQTAEKRHRAVRDNASDKSDWITYDSEGELISDIIKWRRNLEPLFAEIVASGAITDIDTPILPIPISEKPSLSTNDNSISLKITLLGKEYPVGAWNEIFVKVCEVMLLHKPYMMASMDRDIELNTEYRTYFSYIQSDIKVSGKRLSNGLWIETDMDSQEILKISRRLLEKYGFLPDELQVETLEVV
jgi:hypothetical protein